MKNNETGEFELVVGNRQLVSGFFIGVLLLAVVFAMGYVVGQHTQSQPKVSAEAASPSTATGTDSRPQPAGPGAASPAASTDPASTHPASSAAPVPAKSEASPPPAPEPQPTTQPAREAQAPTPAPAPPPTHTAAPAPAAEGAPGSYWQVLATANRTAAQDLQQSLKNKGLPATLSPGPNNLTRVLVGPYTDAASMGRAKTEIENSFGIHPVKK